MIIQSPVEKREPLVLARPDYPFWGFAEVLMMAAFFFIAVSAGLFVVGSAAKTFGLSMSSGMISVLGQMLGYAVMFGVLWMIFVVQDKPLLESLAWVKYPFAPGSLVLGGIALAVAVVAMTVVLRVPNIETPMQKMLSDKPTRLAVGLFGITVGPVVEELLFRGFLQPVLMRLTGVFPGLLITSTLFGLMHAQQYAQQWQLVLGIVAVGFVLGTVRHISGSTKASSILHIAYNSVFFLAMMAAGDQVPK